MTYSLTAINFRNIIDNERRKVVKLRVSDVINGGFSYWNCNEIDGSKRSGQIRYYEDQGLLTPDRSSGNRRLYC